MFFNLFFSCISIAALAFSFYFLSRSLCGLFGLGLLFILLLNRRVYCFVLLVLFCFTFECRVGYSVCLVLPLPLSLVLACLGSFVYYFLFDGCVDCFVLFCFVLFCFRLPRWLFCLFCFVFTLIAALAIRFVLSLHFFVPYPCLLAACVVLCCVVLCCVVLFCFSIIWFVLYRVGCLYSTACYIYLR